MSTSDSFATKRTLPVGGRRYGYYSLPALGQALGVDLGRLPYSLKVLLENLLRNEDGATVTAAEIRTLARWPEGADADQEVAFYPARVLMPDSSGIPLLIDLAAMRDAVAARGLDPARVNPLIPVDLVLDHSVQVDFAGTPDAFAKNMARELERNTERYGAVRWAMEQYSNLRVIPPGNGILHQINIEYLASVVAVTERNGEAIAHPDSLVGMDSHTSMINGLGVFGWGVGGIEAATAMLGEPVSLNVPRVVGCRLTGKLPAGVMATDLVLALTERLRAADVLGAIVEFTGPGLDHLPLADRGTIANMAPEYGATMGFFPLDAQSIKYLEETARLPDQVALVEAYARAQGLWRAPGAVEPAYATVVEFDLGRVEPVLAGPTRPEDRHPLALLPQRFRSAFATDVGDVVAAPATLAMRPLAHGDIAYAAITSCTNTSNPFQMIAAGLLARNAAARGMQAKSWVKTSLSPGSRVVSSMLTRAGLIEPLAALGFHVVGYGCMSCGGGAGPIASAIADEIAARNLVAVGVLSSNRNFEGRLSPSVRGTYLASPPLVVAYALAGSVLVDLTTEAIGADRAGRPVKLAEIWPSDDEIRREMAASLGRDLFARDYGVLAEPGAAWGTIPYGRKPTFEWSADSSYIKQPPFFDALPAAAAAPADIRGARALLVLGDDITTDHISPGGTIPASTEAGRYLTALGLQPADFDRYIARRANHEVMIRGTFANIRIRNEMADGREGGFTRHMPDGAVVTIYEAATRYRADGVPLVVVAGRNYGCGSSRDWAAKGAALLGVHAVIAESFERIHRSNLIGMGVLPLELPAGVTRKTLRLDGSETFDLLGLSRTSLASTSLASTSLGAGLKPGMAVGCHIRRRDGPAEHITLRCRIDTCREVEWYRHGGILPYALRKMTGVGAD